MSNLSANNVAPLKIIEQYDLFKTAVKDHNFLQAQLCLHTMGLYQGGEALAKELADELEVLKTNLLTNQNKTDDLLKTHNYKILKEQESELTAQEILAHIEAFITFLKDKYYDLALAEIDIIRQLGDESCANNLQAKLNKAKNQHNQKTFDDNTYLPINNSQDLESNNLESSNKDNLVAEIYDLIKQGYIAKAKNMLYSNDLDLKRKNELQNLLDNKINELLEQKRQAKIDKFTTQFNEALQNNDWQEAKKIVTQIKRADLNDLQNICEQHLQEVLEKENKKILDNLLKAILQNIEHQQGQLAQKNLKDFKKLLNNLTDPNSESSLIIDLLDNYIVSLNEQAIKINKINHDLQETNLNKFQLLVSDYYLDYTWSELDLLLSHYHKLKTESLKQQYDKIRHLLINKADIKDIKLEINKSLFSDFSKEEIDDLLALAKDYSIINDLEINNLEVQDNDIQNDRQIENFQKITKSLQIALQENNRDKANNIFLASQSCLHQKQINYLQSLLSEESKQLIIKDLVTNFSVYLEEQNYLAIENLLNEFTADIGTFIQYNYNYQHFKKNLSTKNIDLKDINHLLSDKNMLEYRDKLNNLPKKLLERGILEGDFSLLNNLWLNYKRILIDILKQKIESYNCLIEFNEKFIDNLNFNRTRILVEKYI